MEVKKSSCKNLRVQSRFSHRERARAIALSRLTSDPTLIRSTEVRQPLLEFVASFMARTPEYRKVIKSILAKARSELPDLAIPEFSEKEVKRLQSRSIVDNIPRYQAILQMMDFYLFTNLTDHPLWISDQPLVKHNEKSDPYRGNLGLLSKGIELYLPLSPTLLLGLTEPGLVKTHRVEFEIGPEHVEFSNGRQIWFSVRYVYSPKQDFGLAKEILESHPELANPDRPRVV
jgi:hypothetical protein